MQLKSTRKGWENERLSSFLLSRIAFISHPSSIADDLGSDFLCTLFEERNIEGEKRDSIQLFPLCSFAIQIKSGEPSKRDVTRHMTYLRSLELPFYLGFINPAQNELSIYSGHHLPAFFSGVGELPTKLEILPVESLDRDTIYNELRNSAQNPHAEHVLKFPFVTRLRVDDSASQCVESSQKMLDSCRLTQLDISSKSNNEHLFHLDREVYYMVAGQGSAQVYRTNLCKRLGETFHNLAWLYGQGVREIALKDEFAAYAALYQKLEELGFSERLIAENSYNQAAAIFSRSS